MIITELNSSSSVWTTVVFRGPIFCRQCFQIPLDLILSYRFIIMFINKKSLFFTTYLIFQTRTMRIQWAIFGPKVSIWHHRRQNVFYAFWDRANLDCMYGIVSYSISNVGEPSLLCVLSKVMWHYITCVILYTLHHKLHTGFLYLYSCGKK